MAAARCSICDLWMPTDRIVCPVCENPTWESRFDDWSIDWKKEAKLLQKRVKPDTVIPNIDAKLHKAGKHHFVDSEAPRQAGYLDIEAGSILKIRGRYFEVIGPYKRGGEHLGWMLEVIKLVMDSGEIPVLTQTQYEALEVKRGLRA